MHCVCWLLMIPTLTSPVKMPVVNTPPCLLSAQQPGESPSSPAISLPTLSSSALSPAQTSVSRLPAWVVSSVWGSSECWTHSPAPPKRAQQPGDTCPSGFSPTSLPASTGAGPYFPPWGLRVRSVHYLLEQHPRWAVGGVPAVTLPPLFHLCISFQRMKSSQWPLLVIPGVKTYLDLVLDP